MTVTRNPLHGSGRAALPHPALASGDDAKSLAPLGHVLFHSDDVVAHAAQGSVDRRPMLDQILMG